MGFIRSIVVLFYGLAILFLEFLNQTYCTKDARAFCVERRLYHALPYLHYRFVVLSEALSKEQIYGREGSFIDTRCRTTSRDIIPSTITKPACVTNQLFTDIVKHVHRGSAAIHAVHVELESLREMVQLCVK